MKKIWFMLLLLCTAGAFTACSDDDEAPAPTNPIKNCSVPTTAAIGSEVIVSGEGFKAAIAQLSLKDEEGTETGVQNPTFTASGAVFTVPMSLTAGDYTLVLKQNGTWNLGTIALTPAPLPIQGLGMPTSVTTQEALTIQGTGFDATSRIFLETSEGVRTELTVTDRSNGLVCALPADVAEGSYTVVLSQNGGEWPLGEVSIEVPMTLKAISYVMVFPEEYGGEMEMPWFLTYNDQKQITAISYDEEGEMPIWMFEYNDNVISATGEEYNFKLTVEDGKVVKSVQTGENSSGEYELAYDWTYTDGYLTKWNRRDVIEWNGNNATRLGYYIVEYGDNTKMTKGVDVLLCISSLMGWTADMEAGFAAMMGIAGKTSTNLPTCVMDMDDDTLVNPLDYTFNEKGYVSSITTEAEGFPVRIDFTWE